MPMSRTPVRFLPPIPHLCLTLALPLGLAACSTAGSYPSLAYRGAERSALPAPAEPAPPPVQLPPPSADLTTRISGLVTAAQDADRQFASKRPAAERAVGAAARAARTSDSWVSAQVAVSALQASRDTAVAALADLDSLYADARTAAPTDESPSTKAIDAARQQVQGLVNAQNDIISGLDARLRN